MKTMMLLLVRKYNVNILKYGLTTIAFLYFLWSSIVHGLNLFYMSIFIILILGVVADYYGKKKKQKEKHIGEDHTIDKK